MKVDGHRQRGPKCPDTQVPPFLQFRLPQERESYSQEDPVKPGGHLQIKPCGVLLATAQVPPFLQGLPLHPLNTWSHR